MTRSRSTRRSASEMAELTVGRVMLDDGDNLAPIISDMLRSAAEHIDGARCRLDAERRTQGAWPFTVVRTDVAKEPSGYVNTVVTRGVVGSPVLRIASRFTNGHRALGIDPVIHLLMLAHLAEGGEGPPSESDMRMIQLTSEAIGRDPAYDRGIFLSAATAFEPACLFDGDPHGTMPEEAHVLPIFGHLAETIEALVRVTRMTMVRDQRGVCVLGVSPVRY